MIDARELACEVIFEGRRWRSNEFFRDTIILNRLSSSFNNINFGIDISRSAFPDAPFGDISVEVDCLEVTQFIKIDRQIYESQGIDEVFGSAAYGICAIDMNLDFFGFKSVFPYTSFAMYDEIVVVQCRNIKFNPSLPVQKFSLINGADALA